MALRIFVCAKEDFEETFFAQGKVTPIRTSNRYGASWPDHSDKEHFEVYELSDEEETDLLEDFFLQRAISRTPSGSQDKDFSNLPFRSSVDICSVMNIREHQRKLEGCFHQMLEKELPVEETEEYRTEFNWKMVFLNWLDANINYCLVMAKHFNPSAYELIHYPEKYDHELRDYTPMLYIIEGKTTQ